MDQEQFDSSLGGSYELPHEANILRMAAARISELTAINNSLESPQQNKLIFQKLPRHMRRRAMSHNVKRMPQRLRDAHHNQMSKSGLPQQKKKIPSRKHRRRPRNLLLEYNRRKRRRFWLETHIWHAKRFHMVEKWGFKLADYPNDKSFRANYRALTSNSLVQDISFYTCIEISGHLDIIISKIQENSYPSFDFQDDYFLRGAKEETIMIYRKEHFPGLPLGYVYIMLKPENPDRIDHRTLWIWIHPGIYQEIFDEIVSNFNFKLNSSTEMAIFEREDFTNVEEVPSAFKISQEIKIPVYENSNGCEMRILRNSLNRFRIRGPSTLSVLTKALKIPDINILRECRLETGIEMEEECQPESTIENENKGVKVKLQNISSWFKNYYLDLRNLEAFRTQEELFKKLNSIESANELPVNSIIALTVLDPRFKFSQNRMKVKDDTNNKIDFGEMKDCFDSLTNYSAIWDSSIRNALAENFISTSQIDKMRREVLVPGIENDEWFSEEKIQKIPILLIQKPGIQRPGGLTERRRGFGSGFDIILPASWAMPFWLSIICHCVRPGGLRESKNIIFETLNMSSPEVFHPGSPAYDRESLYRMKKLKEMYFKRPPNRRVNFTKLGISSPFFCEWRLLAREWSKEENYITLRDKVYLDILNELLKRKKNITESDKLKCISQEMSYLVPVKVTILRKGLANDFSIICLPTKKDLQNYKEDRNWSGPMESPKSDINEKKRENLRKEHLKLLKRLRKQRVRKKKYLASLDREDKNSNEELINFKKLVKNIPEGNKLLIEEQARKMEELSIPKCEKIRFSCDREVMGFVEQGGFSLSEARGVGRGYVVLNSLKELIKDRNDFVLVRNTQSKYYRLAKIEILIT